MGTLANRDDPDEMSHSAFTRVRQPVFWLLLVSSFNYLKMFAWFVYKHAVVAFCIYAQRGEDVAKRGG